MDIQEFKRQNPDYADVPDVQLADALHAKYYSDMPRDQFLRQVGVAGSGGNFSMSTDRDSYARQFMANNPRATQDQLDAVLAQYDQKNYDFATTPPAANPEPVRAGPRMLSDRAAFDERLNNRLNQGKAGGVVPELPTLETHAPYTQTAQQRYAQELAYLQAKDRGENPGPLPASGVDPQYANDMLRARDGGPGTLVTNAVTGMLGTAAGIGATYGSLTGADQFTADMDHVKELAGEAGRLNGGETIPGRAASLVGSIAPALLGGGAGVGVDLASNGALFGIPAFRDTYKAQKAMGRSDAVALEHALVAAGINTAMPTIAPAGAGALTRALGAAELSGLKGAGAALGQSAIEAAGFSAVATASDKAIDEANGIHTNAPWINPHDIAANVLAFGAMRGAHLAPQGIDAVIDKAAPGLQLGRALSGDIGERNYDPASADDVARTRLSSASSDARNLSPWQTARAQGDVGPSPMTRTIAPKATVDDIAAAPDIDSAIAAASAALHTGGEAPDRVASLLEAIRPPGQPAFGEVAARMPIDPAAPGARIEPVLGGEQAQVGQKYVRVTRPDGSTGFEAAPHEGEPAAGMLGTVDARQPHIEPSAVERAPEPLRDAPAEENWHTFPAETGTLGIPRADMPQVRAEHRGALTNFLNARGVNHEHVELPADQLKPTQAEFSVDKVQKAIEHEGGERSILVSSDGHVLDGHHQWLAAMDKGEPVKAIRFDAPIRDLVPLAKEFPSAEADSGTAPAPAQPTSKLEQGRERARRQEEAVQAAHASMEKRKATGGQRMRERVKVENPFLHFLANHGVSLEDRADIGLEDGRMGNRMVPGMGPVLRRTGKRLDELALLARDEGFLTDHDIESVMDTGGTRKLADMIQRAVAGKEVIGTPAGAERAAPSTDEHLLAEAQRLGIDVQGRSADEVYDAVAAAHREGEDRRERTGATDVEQQAEIERLADEFTPAEAKAIERALEDPDADIPFDLDDPRTTRGRNFTDEEIDALFGGHQAEGEPVGRGEAEGDAAGDAAEGAGRDGAAQEGSHDLLSRYSRDEVVARQDAEVTAEKARAAERDRLDQQRKKEAEDKDVRARMDASAKHFQLGQSAEDGLSGQGNIMFSKRAAPSDKSDPLEGVPRAFLRKAMVDHDVYIEDEGRWQTARVPADKALASVREDIAHLEAMLNCMKG